MTGFTDARLIQIPFHFDVVGEPKMRAAREDDIAPLDKRRDQFLATVGRICAGLLILAAALIFCAFFLGLPALLIGASATLCLVALVISTGQTHYRRLDIQRHLGVSEIGIFERT